MAALDFLKNHLKNYNDYRFHQDDHYFIHSENYELMPNPHQETNLRVDIPNHENKSIIEKIHATVNHDYDMIMMDYEIYSHQNHPHEPSIIYYHHQNPNYEEDYPEKLDEYQLKFDEFDIQIPDTICRNNYLDPGAFLDLEEETKTIEEPPLRKKIHKSNDEIAHISTPSIYEDESKDNDSDKQQPSKKKSRRISVKQDGTLAFLRQCILELKAGINSIFNLKEEEEMKEIFWNYLVKISKKVEIQKQPKKKLKFLIIPCLNEENTFDGLNLYQSNLIRQRCYTFIKEKIESKEFEANFVQHRNYGKIDKNGNELKQIAGGNKVICTLNQYFEEFKRPSKFRGLYSDSSYQPDMDWIRQIESKLKTDTNTTNTTTTTTTTESNDRHTVVDDDDDNDDTITNQKLALAQLL